MQEFLIYSEKTIIRNRISRAMLLSTGMLIITKNNDIIKYEYLCQGEDLT